MHKIYRTIFMLALVLMTLPGMAQQRGHHGPEHHEQRLQHMQEMLDLSEAQVEQMRAIHEKYGPQMKALHEAEGEMDREQMRELHRSLKAEMGEVLTAEQRAKMEEMHERPGPGHHGLGMHGHHRRGHGDRPQMKEARKEVRAYMKENMMPVLQAERKKFDAQLSAGDKATIEDLRAELKATRPQMKQQRKEMRQTRKQGNRPSEEQRAEMRAFREKIRPIMEEAGQIAAKYEAQLKAIHESLEPQAEQWQADIRAIMEKYAPEQAEGEENEQCEGKRGKRKGMLHHGHRSDLDHHKQAVKFILMDPDAPDFPEEMRGEMPEAPALDVFPNPTTSQNRIQYEVQQAGNVTIELVTKEGTLIRELLQQHHEPGEYSLEVDMSGTRTDVYYYRVTDAAGTRIKRFTVVR